MTRRFAVDVARWSERQKLRMRDVVRESVQDVLDIAQTPKSKGGRMPVKDGYLRNSVASGLNGVFGAASGAADPSGAASAAAIELAINGMQIGDVVRFAWTADYAIYQEIGTATMPGNHFVAGAAAQWAAIVEAKAAQVK